MSKVVVLDTRDDFTSELGSCCKSFGAEVIVVKAPTDLKKAPSRLNDTIVLIWAYYPSCQGLNVAKKLMQAIAASRFEVPVILYAANQNAFNDLMEPGMQYPHTMVTVHACTVAGMVKRVMNRKQLFTDKINAFEDWACRTHTSIAGTLGKVSVFAPNGDGEYLTLDKPLNPLVATGNLFESNLSKAGLEPTFY